MSSWINDAAVPNHNGNGFPHINDPSAVTGAMMDPSSFVANPAQFNSQFANPQQMMMQNGPMRNASPSYSNPMYQTNSVIPSKRPRAQDDNISQSPRPAPGMPPASRAETPQQSPYPGFQQPGMPQSSGQPSPYPHLQPNGSANATPSPIMANQMRPGSVPQRLSTTSPHPYSPASQQFPQASPVPSEHGGTPQPNPYMQQNNFPQGFNPQFNPSQSPARPSPAPNPMAGQMMQQQMGQMPQPMPGQMPGQIPSQMAGQMPNQMPNQMYPQGRNPMEQQRMMYQMQLQQQARQSGMQMQQMGQNMMQNQAQAQAQAHAQAQARNMMARQGMPNGQMPPGARPQLGTPQQPTMPRPPQDTASFMKNLAAFMHQKQLSLEANPTVEGRQVNLMMLFQVVYNKFGGYRNISQSNAWPQVSAALGLHPGQLPTAPQQLKGVYERNLLRFEETYMMERRKMQQQQQQGMPGMPGMPSMQGTPTKPMPHGQLQPGQMMQPGQPEPHQQAQMQTPVKQQSPSVNGFSTPQPAQPQAHAMQSHQRNSLSRSVQPTPTGEDFPMASPLQGKAGTIPMPMPTPGALETHSEESAMAVEPADPGDPDEYVPKMRRLNHSGYGGINIDVMLQTGNSLSTWRPDIPPVQELGNIDIHALTKSIQSGITGEIRLALDTLGSLSVHVPQLPPIDLRYCDDLVESLVECAEDQMELLEENFGEASTDVGIPPYEELARNCRVNKHALQILSAAGTEDHLLDRGVERLIGITTILRNFSFIEENHRPLADEIVVAFICSTIKSLGTREMLFRTHLNTLDLMKDLIILLSNIAGSIEIPGPEEAYILLEFLLAFGPSPLLTVTDDRLFFTPYDPDLHPYLPHAVDALAKLFARDDPNRTHYREVFAAQADSDSAIPYELLTRAFALAISPIPVQPELNRDSRSAHLPSLIEARKPLLMQSMLAADIAASLAPGYESGVARLWLASGNGLARSVDLLLRYLSSQFELQIKQHQHQHRGSQSRRDPDLVHLTSLAVRMLKRLSEKARDPSDPTGENSIPPNVLPSSESVLQALSMVAAEWKTEGVLANLVEYASLED